MRLSVLLFFSISLIGLVVATYTDLKERIVSDKITYGMIALGLGLHLYFSVASNDFIPFIVALVLTAATFIAAYGLWKLGMWAGGDVKLFTGLAALNPVNYAVLRDAIGLGGGLFASFSMPVFPLTLFVYSVFAVLPYGAAIALRRLVDNRNLRRKISELVMVRGKQLVVFAALLAALGILLGAFGLPAVVAAAVIFAMTFIWKKFYNIIGAILVLLALVVDFFSAMQGFAMLLVSLVPLYLIIELYLASREDVLASEKKITELREGDISGETITVANGKPKRQEKTGLGTIIKNIRNNRFREAMQALKPGGEVLASERSAGGLTNEQIDRLRMFVTEGALENRIRVKDSAPFVPAVLIAYLALQLTGDVIWNLII